MVSTRGRGYNICIYASEKKIDSEIIWRFGIDAMCKAHTRRGEGRGETPVRTKQKLAQTRAGQTRGLVRWGAGADGIGRRGNVGKRHEGGRRPQPTMEDPSPDDAGQTMWRRSTRRARRGREQDFAEISRRMYEEIRSSRDPRDHVEDG